MNKYALIFLAATMMMACDVEKTTSESVKSGTPVSIKHSLKEGHSNSNGLKWYTIEEVIVANEAEPKMMLIDVYTDWCGWCKVMDKKTFSDPTVQEYIREHFYPVKFNAEQKSAITFNGKEYKFVKGGRRGHNELASHLLNGRLGYPSFAYLAPNYQHMHVSAGFKKPEQFLAEMKNVVSSKQ